VVVRPCVFMSRIYPCSLCGTCEVKPCCSTCSKLTSKWKRVDIPFLISKQKRRQAENVVMQRRIEELTAAQKRYGELLMRRQTLVLRMEQVRKFIRQHSRGLSKEGKRVRVQRQQTRERMEHLKKAIGTLAKCEGCLYNDDSYKAGLLDQRTELALVRSQTASKRKELIFELLTILPILPVNDQQCRVINIVLPNSGDYSGVPRLVLAAALGYVVHIVDMIAGYLGIVLPFQMESRGSQSLIYKEGSSTKYPLYSQNNERELRAAITALNINIAYLCASQGFQPSKHQVPQTLLNLRRLLQSPSLGSDMPTEKLKGTKDGKLQTEDPSLSDWVLLK